MDTDLISILTLIISTLTLVATIYSVFLSKYTYKQTFIIPKKSEALQNLITLISNKINEIKVEDEISEDKNYDIGNRLEWIKTSIEFALDDNEFKDDLVNYMKGHM